jgi:hypothetical protein
MVTAHVSHDPMDTAVQNKCVHKHIIMRVYVYVYVYICVCVCICICMCMYTYTYMMYIHATIVTSMVAIVTKLTVVCM